MIQVFKRKVAQPIHSLITTETGGTVVPGPQGDVAGMGLRRLPDLQTVLVKLWYLRSSSAELPCPPLQGLGTGRATHLGNPTHPYMSPVKIKQKLTPRLVSCLKGKVMRMKSKCQREESERLDCYRRVSRCKKIRILFHSLNIILKFLEWNFRAEN